MNVANRYGLGGTKGQTRSDPGAQSKKPRSIGFVELVKFVGLWRFNPTDPTNSENPANRDSSAAETF